MKLSYVINQPGYLPDNMTDEPTIMHTMEEIIEALAYEIEINRSANIRYAATPDQAARQMLEHRALIAERGFCVNIGRGYVFDCFPCDEHGEYCKTVQA